jgi:hypothetical protein
MVRMISDPVMGFPWMAMFLLVSVVGGTAIYLIRKLPAPPPLPPVAAQFLELVFPPLPWIALVVAVWIGLAFLVRSSCQTPTLPVGTATFEPFQNPTQRDINTYIRRVEQAQTRAESTLEKLTSGLDDTCLIIKDVEEVYVGNVAAPADTSETELSEERQKQREETRRKRGQQRFTEEREANAKKSNTTVLECFASEVDMEAEEDLRNSVQDLEAFLDSAQVQLAEKKLASGYADLAFSNTQFKKALKEGFAVSLRGDALLSYTNTVLQKEGAFYNEAMEFLKAVQETKATQTTFKNKVKALDEGVVEAEDVRALAPVPAPVQGRCKEGNFQFGSYSGGFCCPTTPTKYSASLRDYTECPDKRACSLHKETSNGLPVCA